MQPLAPPRSCPRRRCARRRRPRCRGGAACRRARGCTAVGVAAAADVGRTRPADVERGQRSSRARSASPLTPISTCRLFSAGSGCAGVGVPRQVRRHVGLDALAPAGIDQCAAASSWQRSGEPRRREATARSASASMPSVRRCRGPGACGAGRATGWSSGRQRDRVAQVQLGRCARRGSCSATSASGRPASTAVPSTLPVPTKLKACGCEAVAHAGRSTPARQRVRERPGRERPFRRQSSASLRRRSFSLRKS